MINLPSNNLVSSGNLTASAFQQLTTRTQDSVSTELNTHQAHSPATIPIVSEKTMLKLHIPSYLIQQIERGFKITPFRFSDGSVFDGQSKDGKLQGIGCLYLPKGGVVQGCFDQGVLIGKARLITPQGDVFFGKIVDGKAEGFCSYESFDGTVKFQGMCKDSRFHGEGDMYDGHHKFSGIYEYGLRRNGKLTWGDMKQYQYDGEFQEQVFWGYGVLQSPEGIYQGHFVNGKKQETGSFRWNDGRKYKGRFLNDIKVGQGRLQNSDGTLCYQGEWKHDMPNGKGRGMVDGKIQTGIWKNGKLQIGKKYIQ